MRAFVIVEPKFFTPPEIFPTLLEGFVAWRDDNREHMESFEFFAGDDGGFGIFNGPDEATLNRIMVQYPFFPYSEITVRPILDGDIALAQWREIMSEVMGAGPAVQVSHQESINYVRSWPGLYGVSASWLLALIHRSAWKVNSLKLVCRMPHSPARWLPYGRPETSRLLKVNHYIAHLRMKMGLGGCAALSQNIDADTGQGVVRC